MTVQFTLVDVFTAAALEGNQLAVCVDGSGVDERLMQALAREINYAETTFVLPPVDPAHTARVRIFTPARELRFAGHPVLGTAAVLAHGDGLDIVTLETGNGPVTVAFEGGTGDGGGRGRMSQPIPTVAPWPDPEPLMHALGVAASVVPVDVYDNGIRHCYVVLPDEASVAAVRPDFAALADVAPDAGANCVAGRGGQWKSRMFFPGGGVYEDAATGSAAGPLAVHLARHGLVDWGTEITITQGVEIGRPSTLYARATGTAADIAAVDVAGDTVIVGRTEFAL